MLRALLPLGGLITTLLLLLGMGSIVLLAPLNTSLQLLYISIPSGDGRATLYLHDLRHQVRLPLLDSLGWGSYAAWSPDGRRIAYSAFGANPVSHDIFIYELATGHIQQITNGDGDYNRPDWSPDGTRLVYEGKLFGRAFDLFVHDLNSTEVQRLPISDENQRDPVWSPDGTRILFTGFSSSTISSDIQVYDLNTQQTTTILRTNAYDITPHWSPDGEQIAFTMADTKGYLYITSATQDETPPRLLVQVDYLINNPAWSPDGKWIAFEGLRVEDTYHRHIYVIASQPQQTDSRTTPKSLWRITYGNDGFSAADWRP